MKIKTSLPRFLPCLALAALAVSCTKNAKKTPTPASEDLQLDRADTSSNEVVSPTTIIPPISALSDHDLASQTNETPPDSLIAANG
jgi:hypothetical protein